MKTVSVSLRSPTVAMAFACLYVVWGTTYLAIALAIRTVPPFVGGAVRFLLAAGLLYAGLRTRRARPLTGVDWRMALICGVLLFGLGNGLVMWSQQGVPSGIAALVVAAVPVFVLILDWMYFDKRPPGVTAALGTALAVVGVGAIIVHTQALSGRVQPLHIAALVISVLAWSIGTLLQKRAVARDGVFAFTCAQIFFGGIAQAVFALLTGEFRALRIETVSPVSALAILYLALFGTIVGASCYTWLLARVPAQKVSTYAVVNPVVALLLGAWLLNEPITAQVVGSVALVLLGVTLVLFQDRMIGLFRRFVAVGAK